MPVLYQVPKMHNNAAKPPGRPILSGINSLFCELREYIDVFLQPLVVKSPSYLKDSKDVINHVQHVEINENSILVTIDVESLHTNIRQQDAMNALKWALNKFTNLKYRQKQFILKGLRLAMTNNLFWYGGQHYNQIKGISMWAKYAPSVANIFLNKWEEEVIYDNILADLQVYRRYRHDILLVWKGTESTLDEFINHINNVYGMKFTVNVHKQNMDFLDLHIFKQEGMLNTKTYFKEHGQEWLYSNQELSSPQVEDDHSKRPIHAYKENLYHSSRLHRTNRCFDPKVQR